MTVTAVRKDLEALVIEIEAEFQAPPERIWQLFADPRQLERWWGPPEAPATVTAHELRAGGRIEYHMTGPDGERYPAYWNVSEADPPKALAFKEGFLTEDGSVDEQMPTASTRITISPIEGGTRLLLVADVPDTESMDALLEMQADLGWASAIGQIDAILAEGTTA